MDTLKSFFHSRRAWAIGGTLLFVFFGKEIGMTEQQCNDIALLIGVYVVGESLRSSKVGKPDA